MRQVILHKIETSPDDQVNLESLDIQDDEIQEIAAYIIKHKPSIQEIYLNNNALGDAGGVILAKTLLGLPTLTLLDVQYNNLGEEGLGAIIALKRRYPELYYAFHANQITNAGQLYALEKRILGET